MLFAEDARMLTEDRRPKDARQGKHYPHQMVTIRGAWVSSAYAPIYYKTAGQSRGWAKDFNTCGRRCQVFFCKIFSAQKIHNS